MPLTTQNDSSGGSLEAFVDEVCGDAALRVEQDLGCGYVLLRSSEAQRRQAAQDVRSSEDIVLELLRNARDAAASHIFVAVQHDGSSRNIVVIDDGEGIPAAMHERVFDARVTSKLDTFHTDKWGVHGRGMALYSISVNAREAFVKASSEGLGTSIVVHTSLEEVGEKADQSTFPHFEVSDGVYAMRGPRNIVRTAAEFALEHRDACEVFLGSPIEIAAAVYSCGQEILPPAERAFASSRDDIALLWRLACAVDPADFVARAAEVGLSLSERSARRILDGTIAPAPSLMFRLEQEAFPRDSAKARHDSSKDKPSLGDLRGLKISADDLGALGESVTRAFDDIAERYYLEQGKPRIRVASDGVHIHIPVEKTR